MPQISLLKCAVWSELLLVAWTFHKCYATDWTSFGVSWLKWRLHRLVWVYSCKMPHCWKSHVTAHSVGSLSFWRIRFYRLFTWKYFILSSGKLQDKKPPRKSILSIKALGLVVTEKKMIWAATCDFQHCAILSSVNSDEPVQPTFKLRHSKWCSVSSLTIIERRLIWGFAGRTYHIVGNLKEKDVLCFHYLVNVKYVIPEVGPFLPTDPLFKKNLVKYHLAMLLTKYSIALGPVVSKRKKFVFAFSKYTCKTCDPGTNTRGNFFYFISETYTLLT